MGTIDIEPLKCTTLALINTVTVTNMNKIITEQKHDGVFVLRNTSVHLILTTGSASFLIFDVSGRFISIKDQCCESV